MHSFLRTTALSGVITTMIAASALADVTAEQVWEDLQSYMQTLDATITGTETQTSDGLSISDVVIAASNDEGGLTLTADLLELTERGDGSVVVTMSEELGLTIALEGEDAATGTVTQKGQVVTVEGDETERVYTTVAPSTEAEVAFNVDGELDATVVVTASDFNSQATVQRGDVPTIISDSTIASMVVQFLGKSDIESIDAQAALVGLAFNSRSVVPESDFDDLADLVRAGLTMAGSYGADSMTASFTARDTTGEDSAQFEFGAYEAEYAIGEEGISFASVLRAIAGQLNISDSPVPFDISIAEVGLGVSIPLLASDEEQSARVNYTISDLEISDAVWSLFDPQGSFPRDPATLRLALDAVLRLSEDLNTSDMDSPPVQMPADGVTVNLSELFVSGAGVEVRADGSAVLDADDFTGAEPTPEGRLNVMLTGANALLDKLVAGGFVKNEDAMAVRFGSAMFLRPGDGPDVMVSEIEGKSDGQVIVNGQRIR